jgi:hypothetical protein
MITKITNSEKFGNSHISVLYLVQRWESLIPALVVLDE